MSAFVGLRYNGFDSYISTPDKDNKIYYQSDIATIGKSPWVIPGFFGNLSAEQVVLLTDMHQYVSAMYQNLTSQDIAKLRDHSITEYSKMQNAWSTEKVTAVYNNQQPDASQAASMKETASAVVSPVATATAAAPASSDSAPQSPNGPVEK